MSGRRCRGASAARPLRQELWAYGFCQHLRDGTVFILPNDVKLILRLGAFAPGILGPKDSLYVTRQTLFTHIASRQSTQAMADALFAVVLSGAVKIHIAQRYALADVQQAHRDLEARKTTGSTILTL